MGYKTYTKGKAVKLSSYFNSTEFDCHGAGCCSQTMVNEDLVTYLGKIREHFGLPITITSGYRCLVHNGSVGGATGSRHTKGDAADIVVKNTPPAEVAKYAESVGIKGIGLYETSKDGYFVHIDTRTSKSFWYGQAQAYRSTFQNITSTSNSVNTGNLDTILNRGDYGSAVKSLQEKLISLGYSCGSHGADGDFGHGTESAVRKFQSDHGIGVDGIVGCQTLSAIDEELLKGGNKVRVTANVLNVRSGAGTNYPVVSNVRKGAICELVEEKDGWGRISSPSGWICLQYAEKAN